jgi:uncharacterized protein with ParB-like and HNH nuclease domain
VKYSEPGITNPIVNSLDERIENCPNQANGRLLEHQDEINNYFQLIFEQYLTLPILLVLKKYETDLIFKIIDSQNSALQVKTHALMSNFGTQA